MNDVLQTFGEEKFLKLVSELLAGTPASVLADTVQKEWGDAQEITANALTKQLKKLEALIKNGDLGRCVAERANAVANRCFNCREALIEIAEVQRERVSEARTREKQSKQMVMSLNAMLRDYARTVINIHKIQSDLGCNELTAEAQDRLLQKQVHEAVAVLEDIFRERGITRPQDVEPEHAN